MALRYFCINKRITYLLTKTNNTMKKVFFYLLLLPMMAFTMSSCIKDVAWVTPSSVHFGSEPSSQTVWFYGSYNYYTAEVDADGQGWCTVDDLGDGLVDIVTTENTGAARSCYVNFYIDYESTPLRSVSVMQDAGNGGGGGGGGSNGNTWNGHEFVDLGLPSGTLWATCNVGAQKPEDWGYSFAWGEVETKASTNFDWEHYKYCVNDKWKLTKYCQSSEIGYLGYTDDLTELELCDDAATAKWGNGWRTPSLDQIRELSRECSWSWETVNNVKGNRYTGPNGNSIFIPADADGHYSTIWARNLYAGGVNAWKFTQGGDTYGIDWNWRCYQGKVRPVRE